MSAWNVRSIFSIIFGYMLIGCLYLCDILCRFGHVLRGGKQHAE
jgi:hypothetical protein